MIIRLFTLNLENSFLKLNLITIGTDCQIIFAFGLAQSCRFRAMSAASAALSGPGSWPGNLPAFPDCPVLLSGPFHRAGTDCSARLAVFSPAMRDYFPAWRD
jgi:hypothetical protein